MGDVAGNVAVWVVAVGGSVGLLWSVEREGKRFKRRAQEIYGIRDRRIAEIDAEERRVIEAADAALAEKIAEIGGITISEARALMRDNDEGIGDCRGWRM